MAIIFHGGQTTSEIQKLPPQEPPEDPGPNLLARLSNLDPILENLYLNLESNDCPKAL